MKILIDVISAFLNKFDWTDLERPFQKQLPRCKSDVENGAYLRHWRSGFLGSWCVSQLLEKGYVVNTTVRSMEKAEHLEAAESASNERVCCGSIDNRFF